MTDSITPTDATQLNIPADGANSATTEPAPSHSEEQEYTNNTNGTKGDSGSRQELTRMCALEPSNKQDAESTPLDLQAIQPLLQHSGTVTGCTDETTQDHHHHGIGYKRGHSYSPVRQCDQTPPATKVVITCTCMCTGAGCLESELVVDGGALLGGQREERQPRKRVKWDAMEGEGDGNGCTRK